MKARSFTLNFLTALTLTCATAVARPLPVEEDEDDTEDAAPMAPTADAAPTGMYRANLEDPEVFGGTALSFNLPQGWKHRGRVTWDKSNAQVPAKIEVEVMSGDGSCRSHTYPTSRYMLMNQQLASTGMVPGGQYLGCTLQAKKPESAAQALYAVLQSAGAIPRGAKFQEPSEQPMPPNPVDQQTGATNPGCQFSDVMVTILGAMGEGEAKQALRISGQVSCMKNPQMGLCIWIVAAPAFTVARTGAAGQQQMNVLKMARASVAFNPAFNDFCRRVAQANNGDFYAAVNAAGAMSRRTSAQNDDMIQQMEVTRRADRSGGQGGYSRSSSGGFSDYINDLQTVRDSDGNGYQVHGGAAEAWSNGQGEVMTSDEYGHNPNIELNTPGSNWQRLNR
jgi:hypothetical protein